MIPAEKSGEKKKLAKSLQDHEGGPSTRRRAVQEIQSIGKIEQLASMEAHPDGQETVAVEDSYERRVPAVTTDILEPPDVDLTLDVESVTNVVLSNSSPQTGIRAWMGWLVDWAGAYNLAIVTSLVDNKGTQYDINTVHGLFVENYIVRASSSKDSRPDSKPRLGSLVLSYASSLESQLSLQIILRHDGSNTDYAVGGVPLATLTNKTSVTLRLKSLSAYLASDPMMIVSARPNRDPQNDDSRDATGTATGTTQSDGSKSVAAGMPLAAITASSAGPAKVEAAPPVQELPELSQLEQLYIKVKEKAKTDPKMAPLVLKVAKQLEAEKSSKLAAKIKEQEGKRIAEVVKREADIVKLAGSKPKIDSMQFPGMPGPPPFKPKPSDNVLINSSANSNANPTT